MTVIRQAGAEKWCKFIQNKSKRLDWTTLGKISKSSLYLVGCLAFTFLLAGTGGCIKEFSYEAKLVDTPASNPFVSQPPSGCATCRGTVIADSSWRFQIDGAAFCGQAEKSIITLERTSFTFFGASACSADSGFVASVYLNNEQLNSDKVNLKAKMVCYYYDRVKPSYVYMSSSGQYLQLTITRYEHQTKVAYGTFSGFVMTENGVQKEIRDGMFRIRF